MSLTALQFKLLDLVAHSEYQPHTNGRTPESFEDTSAVWFWADELGSSMGVSEKAVGGVVTSLTEAGLVGVEIVSAKQRKMGDDSSIWLTPAGFEAWSAARAAQAPVQAPVAVDKAAARLARRRAASARRRAARRAARATSGE